MINSLVEDLSVLYVSCDAYSDLWDATFELHFAEWPDCPFGLYLGSNYRSYDKDKRVNNLLIGEDNSWCSNVSKMLEHIQSEYVILMLEDFFLTERTETASILKALDIVRKNDLHCCRLIPNNFKQGKLISQSDHFNILEIGEKTPYRISTQAAIWKKEFLLSLLNDKFSAWHFEGANSWMIDGLPVSIAAVSRPLIHYKHGVERGKWIDQGINNLKKHHINMDFDRRGYFNQKSVDVVTSQKEQDKNQIRKYIIERLIRVKYYFDRRLLKIKLRQNGIIR
jgi:hypothetical protein